MQTRLRLLGFGVVATTLLANPLLVNQARGQRVTVGPGPELTAQERDVADRARTKVVLLRTERRTGISSATGVLAGPRLILTAGHALSGVSSVRVWLNGVSYRADILAQHPEFDLGLLKLRAPDLLAKPAEIAPATDDLAHGEDVVILTASAQDPNVKGDPVTRHPIPAIFDVRTRIRAPNEKIGTMLVLRGSVERGDSGSPILRAKDGKLIGILSSRELPGESGLSFLAYAVPSDLIYPWLHADPVRAAVAQQPAGSDFYLFQR